jgi:hypothetical protein
MRKTLELDCSKKNWYKLTDTFIMWHYFASIFLLKF